ncbi:MBL fold metallo-hydrolase [Methanohalophilus halophilus]|uniref:MBL fold metallo-hydrolase n=2 Tax=Methanohalophilus halophilus TaxID=2177 RepID=A0A1H2S915_9EURY|nr:MBL fold metallo-hydrolase [Methanohalophilus halophilus]RNI09171.1 MBL fold metallo-hydrolase [Methanohalophilus halophilus]SDW28097.1 Ribonuclease BN, tRNA processing enzyme [Methanohalophilus halophilus]
MVSMKIQFLGSGVAIPQPGRVQSGIAVETENDNLLLFDCGAGVLQRLYESGRDPRDVDAIILTHLHLDHVADVLPLLKSRWLCEKRDCVIYGPEGTRDWLDGLIGLYPYLQGRFDLSVIELKPGRQIALDGNDCRLSCAPGMHSVPSLGYRLEDGGKIMVYSGDTQPCDSLMELAQGSDVLIHECSFPPGFEVDFHTTPDMLEPYLGKLDTGKLYLTHLYPQMQGREQESLEYMRSRFKGEVHIASDLLEIDP